MCIALYCNCRGCSPSPVLPQPVHVLDGPGDGSIIVLQGYEPYVMMRYDMTPPYDERFKGCAADIAAAPLHAADGIFAPPPAAEHAGHCPATSALRPMASNGLQAYLSVND